MNSKAEFIGSNVEIPQQHIRGTIINETKNTIIVQTENKTKTITKKNKTFIIDGVTMAGNTIAKRPEDRIKQ